MWLSQGCRWYRLNGRLQPMGLLLDITPRHLRWVDHEGGMASRKTRVVEDIVSLSHCPVPAGRNGSPVASAAGRGGSDRHTGDPGFIAVSRGRCRKQRGGWH